MASAIAMEDDINIASFYAASLIEYYIPEYYEFGHPANENTTDNPNDSKPATI
jgi:hypothetical protein